MKDYYRRIGIIVGLSIAMGWALDSKTAGVFFLIGAFPNYPSVKKDATS